MSAPTRFPNGVTNARKNEMTAMMPVMDPSAAYVWWDDFDNYLPGEWVITTTEAGAGAASEFISDDDGGVLNILNDNADNDNDFLQWRGDDAGDASETVLLEAGKRTWFKARVKVNDATESDFVIGLQITDTSPLAVTDGVFFRKDDGDTDLDFVATRDSSTGGTFTGIHTVVNDTWMVLGWYFDGKNELSYWVDNVKLGTLTLTTSSGDYDHIPAGPTVAEALTVSFGIQNGAAAAKQLYLDYILAVKER